MVMAVEACGKKQPGRMAWCERTDEHVEHQATLTSGRHPTYCYWTGDSYPVGHRGGTISTLCTRCRTNDQMYPGAGLCTACAAVDHR